MAVSGMSPILAASLGYPAGVAGGEVSLPAVEACGKASPAVRDAVEAVGGGVAAGAIWVGEFGVGTAGEEGGGAGTAAGGTLIGRPADDAADEGAEGAAGWVADGVFAS